MISHKVPVLFLLAIVLLVGQASGSAPEKKRVLFLGNSVFTSRGGLMVSFEGFCQAAGLNIQAFSQWTEPENRHGIEFLGYGRIPLNLPEVADEARLHQIIREGGFDTVILEARRSGYLLPEFVDLPSSRGESIPYEKNLEALGILHRTIVESGAQTVLYMHPDLKTTAHLKLAIAQIYQRLHRDLEAMSIQGKQHEVLLVPALFLWMDGVDRFGADGWYFDEGHGNALARYASACMLFTYLTGKDPRQNPYRQLTELTRNWEPIPETLNLQASEDNADWIRRKVWLYYSTRP